MVKAKSYPFRKKRSIKKLVILLFLIGLLAVGLLYTRVLKVSKPTDSPLSKAKTTSTRQTAQTSFNKGGSKTQQKTNNFNTGGVTDNNGTAVSPSSQPQVSPNGEMTLYSPSKGGKLQDGAVISGKSTSSTVFFRLVDDEVGIIAQDSLSVKAGVFSGTIHFTPKSKTGSLEVYSIEPSSGRELNNVEVNVIF